MLRTISKRASLVMKVADREGQKGRGPAAGVLIASELSLPSRLLPVQGPRESWMVS